MISKLNYELAARILFIVPCLLIVFHLCNLLGLIPENIVWTGRISSDKTMIIMGTVSILLNATLAFFGAVRCDFLNNEFSQSFVEKLYPFVFWWLVGNTIVNVFSESLLEILVFTPILILLTICCYRVKDASRNEIP